MEYNERLNDYFGEVECLLEKKIESRVKRIKDSLFESVYNGLDGNVVIDSGLLDKVIENLTAISEYAEQYAQEGRWLKNRKDDERNSKNGKGKH